MGGSVRSCAGRCGVEFFRLANTIPIATAPVAAGPTPSGGTTTVRLNGGGEQLIQVGPQFWFADRYYTRSGLFRAHVYDGSLLYTVA